MIPARLVGDLNDTAAITPRGGTRSLLSFSVIQLGTSSHNGAAVIRGESFSSALFSKGPKQEVRESAVNISNMFLK
jgi:hypothetical protein